MSAIRADFAGDDEIAEVNIPEKTFGGHRNASSSLPSDAQYAFNPININGSNDIDGDNNAYDANHDSMINSS